MVNVSNVLWTSAGQKADGITRTHTHTCGGRQPCRLVPCHPSRLAPEEFRAITQQVGLPVVVLTVGVMTVGVLTVGVLTVGAMTVGVLTVGSMGRPRVNKYIMKTSGTALTKNDVKA